MNGLTYSGRSGNKNSVAVSQYQPGFFEYSAAQFFNFSLIKTPVITTIHKDLPLSPTDLLCYLNSELYAEFICELQSIILHSKKFFKY